MTVLRNVARPMLASMFIIGGLDSLKNARAKAPKAAPIAEAMEKFIPDAPRISPSTLVRGQALAHVLAGATLATGRFPRLSAAVLAATLAPTTAMSHQFWRETDPVSRTNQQVHFFKNVSMAGGLLMATLDPDPHKKFIGARAKDKVSEGIGHLRN